MEKEKQNTLIDLSGFTFHRSLSFKLIIIGMLVILLLIPKFMIIELVRERATNSEEVTLEVMSKWSNNQTITGPAIVIPYNKRIINENKTGFTEEHFTAVFLPKNLKITGTVKPQKLHRSIYDVVVYESGLEIKGNFSSIDFDELNINPADVEWENAELQLGISDLRGISNNPELGWNQQKLSFVPGLNNNLVAKTGVSIPLKQIGTDQLSGNFTIDIQLKGSRDLMFCPLGETTTVQLESEWSAPGFIGNFLPTERKVDADGFSASWNVLHFNRNYPQKWIQDSRSSRLDEINQSAFGVELVSTAGHYQKTTRSAKYSFLIILITFILFFMYEIISKHRIHPIQYILAGAAISIFYLLLLSFSEHVGFNTAYIIAGVAVVTLVFFYSLSFIPKIKHSVVTAVALAGSYLFIYVLLQLESFALLAGSIGLFILLALLMYFTRKINWYNN